MLNWASSHATNRLLLLKLLDIDNESLDDFISLQYELLECLVEFIMAEELLRWASLLVQFRDLVLLEAELLALILDYLSHIIFDFVNPFS